MYGANGVTDERRAKLEATSYPDLDAMMDAYAAAAVDIAQERFRQRLDYEPGSIVAFEAVLSELAEKAGLDYDYEVRLWGGYLGEVLRRRYAGGWEMTQYPGGVAAAPAVEVRGSRLFPLMKVYRRITMGDSESIAAFFDMVTERLGRPAQVN
jgi:hypothetical protein